MANFWFKFEWDAWRNDKQLRRCSKETRGFWIDCIAEMESQQTYFLMGTPDEICRDVVADRGEFDRSIAELSRTEAATLEACECLTERLTGGLTACIRVNGQKCQGVVKIICRRLLRKLNTTEYNRLKRQESRARQMSNDGQDLPSKDKSFRVLDSSPNGEEVQDDAEPPAHARERFGPPQAEPKIMLPVNYQPTPEMYAWAIENTPNLDFAVETEEFVTFWRDIATKNNLRTMRGWHATWKGRMKDRYEKISADKSQRGSNGSNQANVRNSNSKPTNLEQIERTQRVIDQYPTEAELRDKP